jgi:nucleotide-binding universal stress UspA family protein
MSISQTDGPLRVVVGVDGSKQSHQALRWAAQVASQWGAQLEVVIAWEYPAGAYGLATWPAEWDLAQDTRKTLEITLDEVFGTDRPADLRVTVRQGGAAQVLLKQAKGATMLIVGSRGHGGFAGLLLGSVSASVAEHAQCPVLVVHGETAAPVVAQQAG